MNAKRHHRRSIRLKGYDYAHPGRYFVTTCTQDRVCLFGEVVDGVVQLNELGRIVDAEWRAIPTHFQQVTVDEFVVMPNHLHGILVFVGAPLVGAPAVATGGAGTRPAPTSLGAVVGAFKSRVAVAYLRDVHSTPRPPFRNRLWQRNYYEHIVLDEESMNRIRAYIRENPARWAFDRENPVYDHPRAPFMAPLDGADAIEGAMNRAPTFDVVRDEESTNPICDNAVFNLVGAPSNDADPPAQWAGDRDNHADDPVGAPVIAPYTSISHATTRRAR